MKQKIPLIILSLLLVSGCTSLDQTAFRSDTSDLIEFREFIQPEYLRTHLEVIAHDSLEGRGSATPGIRKAADYIAAHYSELGFDPAGDENTYFQNFDLTTSKIDSLVYTIYKIDSDEKYVVSRSVEKPNSTADFTGVLSGYHPAEGPIIFGGFGIDKPQAGIEPLLKDLTENAWVLIFEEIPDSIQSKYSLTDQQVDLNSRIENLLNHSGVNGVLLITDFTAFQYRGFIGENTTFNRTFGRMQLAYLQEGSGRQLPDENVKYISPDMAATLLGVESDLEVLSIKESVAQEFDSFTAKATPYVLNYQPHFPGIVQDRNIVALFEGADPDLKSEVVVLMAHYDHLGIETGLDGEPLIYNGADDNGSGTVALMAIAGALNDAKNHGLKPKRSVLFLHVSAEEIGLLGSRYYSDHPVISIENTIANFNADMIGRSDIENIEQEDFNSVYLIGGEIISSALDSIVVAANERTVELRLDRKYNDLTDRNQFYRRSDHWNFGRLGVPFVFFFTGVHEDYHQPTDTANKIDYEKYHRVVQLIFASTVKTANIEIRPVMDNEMFIDITNQFNR